jgi:hypothetical protein
MQITQEIEYQTFEDVLVTALEGGSNYWYLLKDSIPKLSGRPGLALSERIAQCVWNGNAEIEYKLNIYDLEDEEELLGTLSNESAHTGFQLMAEEYPEAFARILNEQYDADDADIWFQLTIMGEVVFG